MITYQYDMNNDIMQKCLSHHYRMTLQKSIPAEKKCGNYQ